MATKELNYSVEMTAEIVAAYVAEPTKATVETLAIKTGKTVKSIVAKLSKEGVYVKPVRTTKNGDAIVKKDSLADDIGAMLGLSEGDVTSLTKVNKAALKAILAAITPAATPAEDDNAAE